MDGVDGSWLSGAMDAIGNLDDGDLGDQASESLLRWRATTAILARQHGVIGRRQLDEVGVTRSQLEWWIRRGSLERTAPRVWRSPSSPQTWMQRLHRGLLALGPMSWVSHEAAAHIHGLDRTPAERVEFLVVRRQRSRALDEIVHSTRRWGPVDAVELDGIGVTSATRTILDLANVRAHPDRLKAAIDSAVRLELSSPEVIRQRLDVIRSKGRAGVRRIDELLEDAGGHTMLERHFLELMSSCHLPRPETQVVFRHPADDRFVARVDFFFRAHDLVVEVSGRLGHSTPSERQRDAQRRNELQALGLRVYEFTWEDLTQRSVHVAITMRRLLSTLAA